jgi:tRNA-2-methylthio-N6-dimethylallyladenosine synthase
MLLGQNVNSYGKTLPEKTSFAELLREVCKIEGLQRLRFMTSHPKDLSDELIEVMAENPIICPHMHLPVQSGSDEILKKMNRHYDRAKYLDTVRKLREAIPDISFTTDIIVGFPGETEEDFEDTLSLIREVGFDSAFTFIYSKRKGTPAAEMENQVPEEVVKRRFKRLLDEVKVTAEERCARFTGRIMDVLVEEENREPGLVTGRIGHNIVVHLPGDASMIGKIIPVHLKECKGFYYFGEPVRE